MPVRFAPDATFPRQLVVEADVPSDRLADPAAVLAAQLTALLADEADALLGKRIAIGAGSRGIDRIPEVPHRATVLKAKGALPFIVPVMGNHGGATAEGQAGILEGLGITEATVGAAGPAAHGHAAGRQHAGGHAGLRLGRGDGRRRRDPGQPHQAAHRLRGHRLGSRHV